MSKQRQHRPGTRSAAFLALIVIALLVAACGRGSQATPTPIPAPTATPTSAPTPVPPTATPEAAAAPTAEPAPEAAAADAATNGDDESYPAPEPTAPPTPVGDDYPGPDAAPTAAVTQDSYPAPEPTEPETSRIPIVPFVLERPLEPGATVVRGTGPANVPILIANVFLMGEILGEGTIDADGRFEIQVPPLEVGHWIGVAIDQLDGTDFVTSDFLAMGFRGPGAEQVPQVGFMYDAEYVR